MALTALTALAALTLPPADRADRADAIVTCAALGLEQAVLPPRSPVVAGAAAEMGADTGARARRAGYGGILMLIRNARVWPSAEAVVDVRIAAGRVVDCRPGLRPVAGEEEIDAAGCALLPGLHDHHVHLRALAAAQASVAVGPQRVRSAAELAARLREADAAAPPGAWLRCVGYHESVAGPLDRWALDRLLADPARPARPVRVQHRTGGLWVVNSAALAALGLDGDDRRADGRGDGRGDPADAWPGWSATPTAGRPADCGGWTAGSPTAFPPGRATSRPASPRSSARAAAVGVTGFTDATPGATGPDAAGLAVAVADGTIAQRLHCMARADVSGPVRGRFSIGPVKIMLDDDTLPSLDSLADSVRRAHAAGRTVAVHCVTRVQLVLTLAALDAAGRAPATASSTAPSSRPSWCLRCAGSRSSASRTSWPSGGSSTRAMSRRRTFLTCGGCAA